MIATVGCTWSTKDISAMSGHSEFICVDGNPTATIETHADKDAALLYFVEGVCGSLPCGPYKNGYELTCVVCTK